jgi:hypothetical protein
VPLCKLANLRFDCGDDLLIKLFAVLGCDPDLTLTVHRQPVASAACHYPAALAAFVRGQTEIWTMLEP